MLSICLLVSVATSTWAEHLNGWGIELSNMFHVAWLGVLRLSNPRKTNRLLRELEVALLWPISSYLDLQDHHRYLKVQRCDSGITRHSPDCLGAVAEGVTDSFKILARGRNAGHLSVLEVVLSPGCSQLCAVRRSM